MWNKALIVVSLEFVQRLLAIKEVPGKSKKCIESPCLRATSTALSPVFSIRRGASTQHYTLQTPPQKHIGLSRYCVDIFPYQSRQHLLRILKRHKVKFLQQLVRQENLQRCRCRGGAKAFRNEIIQVKSSR